MDQRAFWVGEWLVEPSLDRIVRGNDSIKLEPRAMRVLLLLAKRPGVVISQAEIEAAVWADVVVTPSSVYQSVAMLRRALGDGESTRKYIETIARKGYRLIAPVTPACESSAPALLTGSVSTDVRVRKPVSRPAVLIGTLALLAIGSAVALHAQFRSLGEAEKAIPLAVGPLPVPQEVRPWLLREMAELALKQARPQESRIHLEQALRLERAHRGDKHPLVGWTMALLANSLVWLSEYEQAEAMARQALLAFEEGATLHPDRIAALQILGYILYEAGKYEESELQLRHARTLAEQVYGVRSFTWTSLTAAIGGVYLAQDRLPEAESYLRRAIEVSSSIGADDLQIAYYTTVLARTLIEQQRPEAGRLIAQQALEKLRSSVRSDHPHIASLLETLARSFMATQQYADAEPLVHEAMAIWERNDAFRGRVSNAASMLGEILLAQGRTDQADMYLTRASLELDGLPGGRAEITMLREHQARLEKLADAKAVHHFDQAHRVAGKPYDSPSVRR